MILRIGPVSAQTSLSRVCIDSAALLCRRAGKIEIEHAGLHLAPDSAALMEHRAYVLGSVFTVAAFLEARINELFAFASHGIFVRGSGLRAPIARLMKDTWELDRIERLGVLDKYQLALTLAGAPKLPLLDPPLRQVALIVELRNALSHFKSEWAVIESDRTEQRQLQKLARRLKGQFEPNPLIGNHVPYFPDKCLSYSCAAWCVTHSLSFVKLVLRTVGLKETGFENNRERLETSLSKLDKSLNPQIERTGKAAAHLQ